MINEEVALKRAIDDIETVYEHGIDLKPHIIRNIQNRYLLLGDDIHQALMEFAVMLKNTEKVCCTSLGCASVRDKTMEERLIRTGRGKQEIMNCLNILQLNADMDKLNELEEKRKEEYESNLKYISSRASAWIVNARGILSRVAPEEELAAERERRRIWEDNLRYEENSEYVSYYTVECMRAGYRQRHKLSQLCCYY
jgi:uncharacterized protein YnzC (UPF0291/DUF896 family)